MAKANILYSTQTDKAGLFTISFEGESYTEFQKFITKNNEDIELQPDLQEILLVLRRMVQELGFLERLFRPEGKMKDRVAAIPVTSNKLRLYCLRLSDGVLIVGNGGRNKSRTYDEYPELSGYVMTLQKLDALLKAAELKGAITIEKTTIKGLDNNTFEL